MAYVYILVAVLLWALLGIFAKFAFKSGLLPLEVAFWRATLGAVFFWVHAKLTRSMFPKGRDLLLTLAFGLTGVSLFYSSYQWSVFYGGAGWASVLLYTAPAFVALYFAFTGAERLSLWGWLAIFVTLAGVACLSLPSGSAVGGPALFWGIVSGLSYALYYPYGKAFFHRYPAGGLYALALSIGAVGLAPWVHFSQKSPEAWLYLGLIAFASTYLAYLAYSEAMKRLPAILVSVLATLEPVVAYLLAIFLWGESLSIPGFLGASLILGAAIWSAVQSFKVGGPKSRSTKTLEVPLQPDR